MGRAWEVSAILRLSKVLVVDGSVALRQSLETILSAHCEEVLTASGCREGKQKVAEHPDLSLVLSDVVLPDGDGFEVLEYVASLDEAKPQVILLSGRRMEEDATRAVEAGAIGFLAKPISFRDISRVLRQTERATWNAARAVRRRSLGSAFLIDSRTKADPRREELSHLAWDIRDVSINGAFLETNGPVPVGTRLDLALLFFGTVMARVRAEVVRLQEPSWAHVGGVAVVFKDFDEGSKELLEGYIEGAEADPY